MEIKGIKNIIFDLGGVIIDIDLHRTTHAFAQLTGKSFEETQERIHALELYYRYEVGELDNDGFRALVKEFVGANCSDNQIDFAWNALLLDIPRERIELIKKLKDHYRLFILSNTNSIHYVEVEKILERTTQIKTFQDVFEKIYLSYEIKLCKPSKEIYQYVINDADILPYQTLFIDDNFNNIKVASQLGIKTIHLQPPSTILEIFNDERFFKK